MAEVYVATRKTPTDYSVNVCIQVRNDVPIEEITAMAVSALKRRYIPPTPTILKRMKNYAQLELQNTVYYTHRSSSGLHMRIEVDPITTDTVSKALLNRKPEIQSAFAEARASKFIGNSEVRTSPRRTAGINLKGTVPKTEASTSVGFGSNDALKEDEKNDDANEDTQAWIEDTPMWIETDGIMSPEDDESPFDWSLQTEDACHLAPTPLSPDEQTDALAQEDATPLFIDQEETDMQLHALFQCE
jgi:hypothetical protein